MADEIWNVVALVEFELTTEIHSNDGDQNQSWHDNNKAESWVSKSSNLSETIKVSMLEVPPQNHAGHLEKWDLDYCY